MTTIININGILEESFEGITEMIMYTFNTDTVMEYIENIKERIRITKVIIQSVS